MKAKQLTTYSDSNLTLQVPKGMRIWAFPSSAQYSMKKRPVSLTLDILGLRTAQRMLREITNRPTYPDRRFSDPETIRIRTLIGISQYVEMYDRSGTPRMSGYILLAQAGDTYLYFQMGAQRVMSRDEYRDLIESLDVKVHEGAVCK